MVFGDNRLCSYDEVSCKESAAASTECAGDSSATPHLFRWPHADLDAQIDAIENRTRDLGLIALHVARRAAADLLRMAPVAARTPLRCHLPPSASTDGNHVYFQGVTRTAPRPSESESASGGWIAA